MIINTTILFLRDLLPVFILICYLSLLAKPTKHTKRQHFLLSLFLGTLGGLFFFVFAEHISEFLVGSGIEITKAILLLITYLCLTFYQIFNQYQGTNGHPQGNANVYFILGIVAFITLKSSEFIIFFNVYIQQINSSLNILIGCLIGIGICISFSVLFSFILNELTQRKHANVFVFCWYLFLAGQVSHCIDYLSQVDLVNTGTPIFNLNVYIKDSSEYGHILKALIGYEASPSATFVILYILSLTIPLIINILINSNHKTSEKERDYE